MNRIDTSLVQNTHRLLTIDSLAAWSAADFALARDLCRAPTTFTGGFANAQTTLGLRLDAKTGLAEPSQFVLPLMCDGALLTLHIGVGACDALANLLDRGPIVRGCGATLSLDAIEALVAGLLAPLDDIAIGQARWVDQEPTSALVALHLNHASLPVTGDHAAISSLRNAMALKADRLVTASLTNLRPTTNARAAVQVEMLLGAVHLSAKEREAMQAGGGVLLDSFWHQGRTVAARRFVAGPDANGDGWTVDPSLADALVVRQYADIRPLEQDTLYASTNPDAGLQLMDAEVVVATGRLTAVHTDGHHRPVFILNDLPSDWTG